MPKKIDKQKILQRARDFHGNKYDYSTVVFNRMHDRVSFFCPIHGEFEQTMNNHIRFDGCPGCNAEKKSKKRKEQTLAKALCRASAVHGGFYDYSFSELPYGQNDIDIVCPIHGMFQMNVHNHVKGYGCPKCANEKDRKKREEKFLNTSSTVHNDYYDYSRVHLVTQDAKVEIVCPVHGSFWQTANTHLKGSGCPDCGDFKKGEAKRMNFDHFVLASNAIHDNRYQYVHDDYIRCGDRVTVICPAHGKFEQDGDYHLRGRGCPRCFGQKSLPETEMIEFVENLIGRNKVVCGDRQLMKNGKELDVVIPEHKLAIEFNGLYWHSTAVNGDRNYHLDKTLATESKGYRLIHIYEDEWRDRPQRVKNFLASIMNRELLSKYNARDLVVKSVTTKTAKKFLSTNHIQGFAGSSIKLGLYTKENKLVAYMGFVRFGGREFNMNRFATVGNVRGGFSKLLSHFKRDYEWSIIRTYADRRHSDGYLYIKNGFCKGHYSYPSFDYVRSNVRFNRQQFMKYKQPNLLEAFDEDKTEEENMKANGYYKIWNCGFQMFYLENIPP